MPFGPLSMKRASTSTVSAAESFGPIVTDREDDQ